MQANILKNGSEVSVPANAFVDETGSVVKNSEVVLTIAEALSARDWLTNLLNTQTTDGQMLESGGMIKITASVNNKQEV